LVASLLVGVVEVARARARGREVRRWPLVALLLDIIGTTTHLDGARRG